MRRSHTTSESPAADGGIRGFALRILRWCTSVLPSPLPWRRFSISGCAAGTAGHWSARGLPFLKVSCWLPIAVLLAQLLCRRPSIRRSALRHAPFDGASCVDGRPFGGPLCVAVVGSAPDRRGQLLLCAPVCRTAARALAILARRLVTSQPHHWG